MKFQAFFDRDFSLAFESKPAEAIRAMLKRNGFRWSPAAGRWWRRGCKFLVFFFLPYFSAGTICADVTETMFRP